MSRATTWIVKDGQLLRTSYSKGALLISHDRECLALCEEILELSSVGLTRYGGGWSAYAAERECERARLSSALEGARRQRDTAAAEITEQASSRERQARHAKQKAQRGGVPRLVLGARKRQAERTTGNRAHAMLEKAQAAIDAAREALARLKVDPVMYADIAGDALPAQKLVAQASAFNVRFRGWIYEADLDFSWRGNVRVAIHGPNGSGKTTLLKALRGELFETRGELLRGELTTVWIDQKCGLPDEERSVLENMAASCPGTESEIRNALARFLFTGQQVLQPAKTLSGGERLRAALARAFLGTRAPELMLLDEPTNNLDLVNVEFLEELMSTFKGAVVVVSHDTRFLNRCGVTQELTVRPTRVART
jgi:ATPase subunit of ABC transporter with duplicated ATPase domains